MKSFIKLSRPKQWAKNILIFSVPALSFQSWMENYEAYINLLLAIAAMILTSTSVYAFNDASDWELDSLHPTKKMRPVANGDIKVSTAYIFSLINATVGVALGFISTGLMGTSLLLLYLLINVLYSFKLKNLPYIEMVVVVYGYPLRVILGALAVSSAITPIFITIIILLSSAIVIAKRVSQKKSTHGVLRKVVSEYPVNVLEKSIIVLLSVAWVFLIYWIISKVLEVQTINTAVLSFISTLAIAGSIIPFLHISKEAAEGRLESPEVIAKNPVVLTSSLVFSMSFLIILGLAL